MKQIEFGVDTDRLIAELTNIRLFIETENRAKQEMLDASRNEISQLKNELVEKNAFLQSLEKRLSECKTSHEANQQIINKLLSDISRMQNDIDWYKRTYEKRSLAGYIKEYIKKRTF